MLIEKFYEERFKKSYGTFKSSLVENKIKNIGTNERLRAFIDKYKDTDCRFKNS